MENRNAIKALSTLCTHLTIGNECGICIPKNAFSPSTSNDEKQQKDEKDESCEEKQQEDELGSCPNKMRNKRQLSLNNGSSKKRVKSSSIQHEVENKGWGYSTTLMLYDGLWKIKKVLKESDLGNMSRLLIAKELAENLIVPVLGEGAQIEVESEEGIDINIYDVDTKTMHNLIFKKWGSSRSYVFIGNWIKDFVNRRNLKKGDEIGFHWNPYGNYFNFTVFSVYVKT